ncbi:hydroxyisourate hydrolase [Meiothermus rufus]|uniref:hydroxyisourate hydrolase n=1 Tax=Meiothermus rufus TaxID=604332 RepID=UPI000412E99C|nr:hydroxyisourate hydrolase [Meiothermus rufus]
MARLTTHVLDTAHGHPATGLELELYRIGPAGQRTLVAQARTNADGRTEAPLLSGETLPTGVYELVFYVAAYFRAQGVHLPDPPFLDEVVVRFGLAEAKGHYHVPLLVSPYGYSTYRGS